MTDFNITQDEVNAIAKTITGLVVLEKIGKGGQKVVYKAKYLEKNVIFKIFKPTQDVIERTKREIRAASIIDHSYIPTIYKANVEDFEQEPASLLWLIEEYIEGETLKKLIESKKVFNINHIYFFLERILEILIKAEEKEIVHRDIKPDNIIFDSNGEYWLIDFGIARHLDLDSITPTHSPFGNFTVGYAASEQFRNNKKEISIRADLFSLGIVAAELIIGYNPHTYNTQDIFQVIRNIEQEPLPILKIEGDTQYLLAKFIKILGDNRLSRRPQSAQEAYDILKSIKSTLKFEKE